MIARLMLTIGFCGIPSAPSLPGGAGLSAVERALWQRTVAPRLAGTPWTGAQRYDAAHLLMVPLHAAFKRRYEVGQLGFADHVGRFLADREAVRISPASQLSWLQYFYLLSRFLVLAAEYDRVDLIPAGLPDALSASVLAIWGREPAMQWERPPFPGGVRERLEWKLSDAAAPGGHSYEHAVLDSELFLFAIAADLRQFGRRTGSRPAMDPALEEIGRFALRVYRDRVVWGRNGGWTFQPGVWSDHPDHRYSCWREKQPGLQPCSLPDETEDASHSHRAPLWLRSLAESAPAGSPERSYYFRLLRGLERQFFSRVAVPPTAKFAGWRLRNYMGGRNGIYRWGYRSLGAERGYGPYELSGTLLHGWWSFLPGDRTRRVYTDLARLFPLSRDQHSVYVGPPPAGREAASPAGILADGTAELLCRLAAKLR